MLKSSKADRYEDSFLQYTLVKVLYKENHKVLCYREKGVGERVLQAARSSVLS